MNNAIFRRKFVLGVLIALMFGLGVHGIVDAQTNLNLTPGTGSISVGTAGTTTDVIRATVAPSSTDAITGYFTFSVSGAEENDTITVDPNAGPQNAEIVNITYTRSSGPLDTDTDSVINTGSGTGSRTLAFDVDPDANDDDPDNNVYPWRGTIRVDYRYTAGYGLYEINVDPNDSTTNVVDPDDLMRKAYVVQATSNAQAASGYQLGTGTTAVLVEDATNGSALAATVTGQSWTQVNISISGGRLYLGSGALYLSGTRIHEVTGAGRYFTGTLSVFTGSTNTIGAVTVYPNTGTVAKVTVRVVGSTHEDATREIYYLHGEAALVRVSGNSQVGYTGSALSSPLVVRLIDDANDRPVPGQTIVFTASGGGLSPGPGTTIAPGTTRTFPATPISILTSTSGQASVNFSLLPGAGQPTLEAVGAGEPVNFDVYVVTLLGDVGAPTITAGNNTTTTPKTHAGAQNFLRGNQVSVATSAANLGVQFTIAGGSLYLNPDDLDLTSPRYVSSLFVSSGTDSTATAYVRVNSGSTAKVTATILGPTADDATHVITYFYGPITFEMVSGDEQVGNVDTNLVEPFVVQVLDGNRPVSGQVVTFASVTAGGTLVKDPGFPDELYADDFPTPATAMTDSNGRVSVLLQLSDTAVEHTVTATFAGQTETFTAEALAPENLARIAIDSGNNQSALLNHKLDDALVVIVYDSLGRIVDDANVRFYVDASGTLVDPDPSTDPGELVTDQSVPNTVSTKTVTTDETGRASVRYNVGGTSGKRTVTAILLDDVYDSTGKSVPFTIYGTTTTTTPDPGTGTLTVSSRTRTGTQGQQVSVTVTGASPNATVQISSFSLPGLASGTANANGSVTITFNLPSTTGTHNVTVTSGGQSVPLTLVVESTQTQRGSLRVSGGPFSGAPNETVNVTVTTSDSQDNVPITISTGPFNNLPLTKQTGSLGSVTFTLGISGNASARDYTPQFYVDDGSYSPISFTVTVTGTSTPTPTQDDVRIQISGNSSFSGTTGTPVTLEARVVDNSNQQVGVDDVNVDFYNSSNRLLGSTRTNSRGYAFYSYRILTSPTTQTVTAEVNDSDYTVQGSNSVTFTITSTGTQPTTSTLTIIQTNSAGQTSNIGAPGALHTIRVLLPQRTANQRVILDVVRTSDRTNVGTHVLFSDVTGTATTPNTFKLPTTAGTYTITASAGTNTATATLTVFAIRLVKDSSDSVSGDDQEGDRGEVLDDPFALRVVRDSDSTAVQGVDVTFTVTDGDGELSASSSGTNSSSSLTVRSDSNGDVEAYLVLDEDQEDNEVTASIAGATDVTFTASGLLVPDNIEIVSGDDQQIAVNRRSAPMIVRVTDEDGNDLEGVTVSFTSRGPAGATLSPRSAITDRLGEAEADLVSRVAGTYFVDARVSGLSAVRFTITVGDLADSIRIVSGNSQRGDPGTQLANPLVVEVLDDDGDTVSGVTVTFRVTGGGGSLSATSVSTNSSGRAQTTLTLGDSPGGNSVRASVSGVSGQVTFSATAVNPAPPEPVIHLGSGQRADSYWINTDSGTLHRLVGGSVENIAPGVNNVVSLVVTSNRLYWVEDTGNNSGRLRRSNLNGTNIQLIRDLTATPAGITVDTANSKIYLTNAWGKVQSINADGSSYAPNLITGLSDPKDIAVGSGKVYWITGGGTVHSANVNGSGITQIAGGYSALGSIAVGGGKVFWTETISESDGNIHSANLNGTGVQVVVSLLAAPNGISVDTSANKLYFTNSRGRIMQGNLDGSGIQVVASNLVALGDVSVPSGTAAPRPPGTFSQYDVNRDGTVDNTDAALVAAALGESPPSNPRLDVNGDGMVNFLDLLLVFDNRDNTNAAPVALANNLPNVSREEIQNQIEQLLASDNQSATAQFTLAYLQNLLEVVTPEKTRLLANYPNPFNPETWIPYQLATSSEVQITIYNSAGREVRTLALGHQSKGFYTDRNSAAYWDGRNVIGEQVASGVYFYTLTTDRISATRKMLILK